MLDSLFPEKYSDDMWFDMQKNTSHQQLVATIALLDKEQAGRLVTINRNVRLYNNALASPYQGNPDYTQYNSFPGVGRESRISINVCKSCVDTAASKIAKNKIKPTVLTDGADWDTQRKAQKLDKAVRSLWTNKNTHKEMRKIFVDAAVTGTGCLKIIDGEDTISFERVLCTYLVVDDMEAIHGKPLTLYQYHYVDRGILMSKYDNKDKREAIAKANSFKAPGIQSKADIIRVYEAWRLPSDGKGGRHVICINNMTLLDEEWVDDSFPFVFFKWQEPSVGFWGSALLDELWGLQMEISKIMYFIQQAMHLGHAPKWIVHQNTNIPQSHFRNTIGDILKYHGPVVPQYIAPNPIGPQVMEYLQWLISQAYRITGISELSAQSTKPAGINSGKAMQTYNDIETQRFVLVGQSFEDAHIDLYYRTVDAARRITKVNPDFALIVKDRRKGTEKVPWADVDMKDDMCVNAFPTSMLPHSPEGRLAFVEEMLQAGKIDDDTAMELLDFPDTSAYREMRLADTYAIQDAIADIIETGSYLPPEEMDNLEKALDIAHRTYLRLRSKGAPEQTLTLLRSYMLDAKAMSDRIKASQQPPQQMLPTQQPLTPTAEQPSQQMTPTLPGMPPQ
jgi:hypothetical protein